MLRFILPLASLMLTGSLVGALSYSLQDGNGPLPTRTSFTAVILGKDGVPNVECWELASLTTVQKVQRKDGSIGLMTQTNLSATDDRVSNVDVLTFPTDSALYPPSMVDPAGFDVMQFALSCVQNGILKATLKLFICGEEQSSTSDPDALYFGQENGNDWFYFEDNFSGQSNVAAKSNLKMETVGNNGAEVVRFAYDKQPKHTVLHKGQCRFSGIEQPDDKKDRTAGKVTGQVVIEL